MRRKWLRLVLTLRAKPWVVIHFLMWMPMAAAFTALGSDSSPTHTPVHLGMRPATRPYRARTRISASSTPRTYFRTSCRSGFRSKIG